MSYPQKVPEGWTRGEPVYAVGTGPRYAICRGTGSVFDKPPANSIPEKEFCITFDSHDDAKAWLTWWKSPVSEGVSNG